MTGTRALEIAVKFLEAFGDNSSYDQYLAEEGIDSDDYSDMLGTLQEIKVAIQRDEILDQVDLLVSKWRDQKHSREELLEEFKELLTGQKSSSA